MKTLMEDQHRTHSLVEQAQAGDRAAFEQLVAKFQGPLEAAVRGAIDPGLRATVDVDGILQETFLRAFKCVDRFAWRGEGSFSAWLRGIARNIVLDTLRKRRPAHGLTLAETMAVEDVSPSRAARRGERFDRLEEALGGLRPDHRQVLVLSRLKGLSIAEIAARMERSPDAVKKLLARALGALRKSFGDTESLHLPQRRMQTEGDTDGE